MPAGQPVGNSNSIEQRNRKAARDSEALLWGALCDMDSSDEDAAESLMAQHIEPDCVIMNPLLHPDRSFEALTANSEPYTLTEALEKLSRSKNKWTSYRMHKHDPEVAIAQVEMMSVQIMYKVTLIRERHRRHHRSKGKEGEEQDGGEEDGETTLQTVDAFCSSTWRQGAGGDWKLCAQQLVPVPA